MDIRKKLILIAVAVVTALTVTTTAVAAGGGNAGSGNSAVCQDLRQAQGRFNALTDEQKAEVYKLYDDVAAQLGKLVTQYADYGVISNETASALVSGLTGATEHAKTEGRILFGVLPPPPPCPKGE